MNYKVCGMRDADNIREVEALGATWMGFIFWPGSSRYVSQPPSYLPEKSRRVGVFVDTTIHDVLTHVADYGLQAVQLHGHETPDYLRLLRQLLHPDVLIIKALSVNSTSDLIQYKDYEQQANLFLFDTKSPLPGGSGKQFDWTILRAYDGQKPFLLSGGIGPDDVQRLRDFQHPRCIGIDLNSRFEQQPAYKDIQKLKQFIQQL
ncbi:MAG: phosphoribosylanthranilate isomerase [Prevotella sp.]|nr:phosphoribosylanthranilate isomerase [Prevotella sp.]